MFKSNTSSIKLKKITKDIYIMHILNNIFKKKHVDIALK